MHHGNPLTLQVNALGALVAVCSLWAGTRVPSYAQNKLVETPVIATMSNESHGVSRVEKTQ